MRNLIAGFATFAALQLPFVVPSLISPPPVFAIPKASAIAKLKYVTVTAIVKSADEFVYSDVSGYKLVSLFLSRDSAQSALDSMKKSDRFLKASLRPYSLDKLIPVIESSSKNFSSDKDRITFVIVTDQVNTDKAYEILSSEGLSDLKIKDNLRVPVFFTQPMVNMKFQGQGNKQVFFMNITELESVLSQVPDQSIKPKIKVLNLDQVIELIRKNRRDLYTFYPNDQAN